MARPLAIAAAAALLAGPALAQEPDWSKIEIKAEKVADSV